MIQIVVDAFQLGRRAVRLAAAELLMLTMVQPRVRLSAMRCCVYDGYSALSRQPEGREKSKRETRQQGATHPER